MTESGHLSVNFVRLLETSSHIQKAIGALESQLDQLEQAAAPLVRTWSGEAQQAYQERHARGGRERAPAPRQLRPRARSGLADAAGPPATAPTERDGRGEGADRGRDE